MYIKGFKLLLSMMLLTHALSFEPMSLIRQVPHFDSILDNSKHKFNPVNPIYFPESFNSDYSHLRHLQIVKPTNITNTTNTTDTNNPIVTPIIEVAIPLTSMKWNSSLTVEERREYEVITF
jgi:hypothetical protein